MISTGDVSPTSQPLALPRIDLEPRYRVPKLIFLLFDPISCCDRTKATRLLRFITICVIPNVRDM